jgi:DNA-directed RNA polymerase subunit RPC12/RpoP
MAQITCKDVPKSVVDEDYEENHGTTRAVLCNTGNPDDPIIVFEGSNSYICGNCSHILADRIDEGQLPRSILFECPKCNEYNAIC